MAYKLTNNKTAKYGEKSQSVGNLQTRLNTLNAGKPGYVPLKVDNMYGPLTKAALAFTNQGSLTTPTPQPKQPTAGSMYNINGGGDNGLGQAENDLQNFYTRGNTSGDQSIRDMVMQRLQAEIDATNNIYNEKMRQARLTGQGRIGTSTAIQGRRGLLGSDFGTAITDVTNTENNQIYAGVDAERGAAIQAILGRGNAEATRAIADKNAAYESGLKARIEHLKNAGERQATQEERAAQAIFDSGKDISEFDKQTLSKILSTFPDSPKEVGVLANFNKLKKAQEAETAKAQAEAEKIARESQFNLSEGQARYDANGNIIASRGKTYAPKAGGSSTGGIGGVVGAVVTQPGTNPQLDKLARQLLAGKGLTKQQATNLKNLIYTDGVEGLKDWAYNNKLGETDQQTYDLYTSATDAFNGALAQLDANNITAGPYASLLNKAKPYAGIKRNKDYVALNALIEQGQAQLRKGYYGTAVTNSEAGNASKFLIEDRDDIETIRQKLDGGAKFLQFVNDAKIARELGIEKPKLSDYTKSITTQTSGTTSMIGPDGKQYSVPNANVAAFIKAGGRKL